LKKKQFVILFVCVVLTAIFVSLGIRNLTKDSQKSRLDEKIFIQNIFRRQFLDPEMQEYIKNKSKPGEILGLYWLDTNYGSMKRDFMLNENYFKNLEQKWSVIEGYWDYIEVCKSIWDDVEYFPVAELVNEPKYLQSFVDSWMSERTYGGKRGHEGTDIIASVNESDIYPVISMTDGTVVSKGWLEKGGYRIGIQTLSGAYFYYAHLSSYADLEIGEAVKAGDFLGYMGDTGYGPEGTTGQFPVHLHLGIYIYPDGIETSINPYPVLKYIESEKVKCVP